MRNSQKSRKAIIFSICALIAAGSSSCIASPQEKNIAVISENTQTTFLAQPAENHRYIGLEKAKSIAVKQAGLSVSDVVFKKAKLDHEDGIVIYEIEFYHNHAEYECEIDAISGDVLKYSYKKFDFN